MSIPRPLKLGIVTILPLAIGAGAWFAYKNLQGKPVQPPPPVKEAPVAPVVEEPVKAKVDDVSDETNPDSCGPLNTWAKLEGSDYNVPDALKFHTSVKTGEAVTYPLPFALDKDLNFNLTLENEGNGSEDTVAHCQADGSTLRCTEVFSITTQTFCGPLKLADGSQKFVQLRLDVKGSGLPLPSNLDQFAVSRDSRALGYVIGSMYDEKRTTEQKIYRSLPILIWESSDTNAKLLGTIPGEFFANLGTADPNTVYLEKVGDRYLTNMLSNSKESGKRSRTFHWISQLDAKTYEDYVRGDIVTCINTWSNLCKTPSINACKNQDSVDRSEYQVDKAEPILRNESEWVVFKPIVDQKLPTLYMPLDKFPENTAFNCD